MRPHVALAHNHPSGVAEPSRADELLTQTLKQALALVDVTVLDHFVVAGASHRVLCGKGVALASSLSAVHLWWAVFLQVDGTANT